MQLANIIDQVYRKAYRSRTRQEVINAINAASRRVYHWIQKETPKQKFLKWDTSNTLTNASQEVLLPPDCRQIARLREFDPNSNKWRIIHFSDLNDMSSMQGEFESLISYEDDISRFRAYGPYRKAGEDSCYIQIQPATDVDRQIEIIYDAAFIEVEDENTYFMIPEEAREIVKNYALSEVLEDNDDSLAAAKEARAEKDLALYLSAILRQGQTQDTPKQEPYL